MTATATSDIERLVGSRNVRTGRDLAPYLQDATQARGLQGRAAAAVLPADAEQVAAVLRWSQEHGVAVVPRGGGSGYAGGAVPQGGIVLSLERLRAIRSFDPLLWRGEIEAGVRTSEVRRLARENGLLYPPDPGAAEQSQIGGNVATNAGGPHAFKYGVTGAWVTGLEAVLASGEPIRVGGATRKDVAGYDLTSLLVGSEGTLAVITAVSLRFIPAPESALPVVAFLPDAAAGGQAIENAMASGITPAAIEYLDADALRITRPSFPGPIPAGAGFVVIAEADGTAEEAAAGQQALIEAMGDAALDIRTPVTRADVDALWRWRDGIGLIADGALGGKISEDIAVPIDRLPEAIEGTARIGARHRLQTCSWGHAGDGNLHSTFMFSPGDESARGRAAAAAIDLFALAIDLGGSVSGEHGVGLVKAGQLRNQWPAGATDLHRGIKQLFDPRDLLNPGKKAA
jgi:glycolate oxidase subunit GlcD